MFKNLKEIEGNLLDFPEGINVLIHGANCLNVMGSGIAVQIKQRYPEAFDADTNAAKTSSNKLGYFSGAKVADDKYIINLYSQQKTGSGRQVNYEAIYAGLERLKKVLDQKNQKFILGFPQIGCGLAGGDWNVVKPMITSVFGNDDNYEIVIVYFKKKDEKVLDRV